METMEQFLLENLYLPIWAGLFIGYLVYELKNLFLRERLKVVILTEIKSSIRHAIETREYLQREDHYWLKQGDSFYQAPKDSYPGPIFFSKVASNLHVILKVDLEKILAFYNHLQKCERLKTALFERIRDHAIQGGALEASEVEALSLRRDRIVEGYAAISTLSDIQKLKVSSLPKSYEIPDTSEIAELLYSSNGKSNPPNPNLGETHG